MNFYAYTASNPCCRALLMYICFAGWYLKYLAMAFRLFNPGGERKCLEGFGQIITSCEEDSLFQVGRDLFDLSVNR